jgi:hypothetical protein
LEFYPILKHVFLQTKTDLCKDFFEKNPVQPLRTLFHTFAAHCIVRHIEYHVLPTEFNIF